MLFFRTLQTSSRWGQRYGRNECFCERSHNDDTARWSSDASVPQAWGEQCTLVASRAAERGGFWENVRELSSELCCERCWTRCCVWINSIFIYLQQSENIRAIYYEFYVNGIDILEIGKALKKHFWGWSKLSFLSNQAHIKVETQLRAWKTN